MFPGRTTCTIDVGRADATAITIPPRGFMRLRTIAPALLSAALYVLPAPALAATRSHTDARISALAAARAGLYSLSLAGAAGAQRVDLVIEQAQSGITALLLTPTHETWLTNVKFDGKHLTGTALTSAGRGFVALDVTDAGVRGTLTVAGRTIAISGSRDR